jgi:hypothetical protein
MRFMDYLNEVISLHRPRKRIWILHFGYATHPQAVSDAEREVKG